MDTYHGVPPLSRICGGSGFRTCRLLHSTHESGKLPEKLSESVRGRKNESAKLPETGQFPQLQITRNETDTIQRTVQNAESWSRLWSEDWHQLASTHCTHSRATLNRSACRNSSWVEHKALLLATFGAYYLTQQAIPHSYQQLNVAAHTRHTHPHTHVRITNLATRWHSQVGRVWRAALLCNYSNWFDKNPHYLSLRGHYWA